MHGVRKCHLDAEEHQLLLTTIYKCLMPLHYFQFLFNDPVLVQLIQVRPENQNELLGSAVQELLTGQVFCHQPNNIEGSLLTHTVYGSGTDSI